MARVTVTLPPLLTNPSVAQRALVDMASDGAKVAVTELEGALKISASSEPAEGNVPKSKGHLAASLTAIPPQVNGTRVTTGIQSPLPYAPVQDLGRRAGRRLWFGHLLYGPGGKDYRKGWVWRQMRHVVQLHARNMQAAYNAQHPNKRKGVSRRIDKWYPQAAFLLARGIARKIARQGMKGRKFLRQYAPGGKRHDEFVQGIREEVIKAGQRKGFLK